MKLNLGIVAIAALVGAMILPFFFRRTQKPTQPTQQIDATLIKQAISDLTTEIQATKKIIEQIEQEQEKQTDIMKSKKEEEDKKFKVEKETTLHQKVFSFKDYKPHETHQLIFSIIGLVAVIIGFGFTYSQLQANAKILSLTLDQNIMSHTLNVDKLFIDSPDLRPYFFDRKQFSSAEENYNNTKYNKALAIADYQIDFFNTFFDQKGDWLRNDLAAEDAWLRYMHDSFKQSPIMCERLYQVRSWYTRGFVDIFTVDCPQFNT